MLSYRNGKTSILAGVLAMALSSPAWSEDAFPKLDPALFDPPKLVGVGPFGEVPGSPDEVKLTPDELAKVKAGKFRVGISMMTMDIDFSKVLVAGMLDALKEGGVEVVAVTDASWKPDKQISDLENLIQLKPHGITSVPADGTATASGYQKVSDAGIKLILGDTVPKGLTYPKDYQAAVGPDQAGIGQVAASLLATRIPKGGTVGIIEFDIDLWAANERARAARRWYAANRPDIKIKALGSQNPNQVAQVAGDFLTANPDVQGLWATFDGPALGVISAMRDMGLNLPIATEDLGGIIAVEIAQGTNVIGVGAQRLTDQGRADANAMMKTLIGQKTPSYIAVPALTVTKENLLEGWQTVWNQPAPASLKKTWVQTPGCK